MKHIVCFIFLLSFSLNTFADKLVQDSNTYPSEYYIESFAKAKRLLLTLYANHKTTFYCSCTFDDNKMINAEACGYSARKNSARGSRLEWEHVVPASRFGRDRICWKEPASFSQCLTKNGKVLSGRKCCRKVDPTFKEMEADMLNLVPAVGELNADRSNYVYGEIKGEARKYGQCDFEVNTKLKIAEPELKLRGDISRIYYYFQEKYGLLLTDEEKILFSQWDKDDPVDEWELEKLNKVNQVLLSAGKRREKLPVFVEAE